MKITWVIDPSDTTKVPVVGTTTPTQGQGVAYPSGLTTNGCGTLYFINKSNVVVYIAFEDGSITELPAWWARPYAPKTRTNQLWLTQGKVLATNGQPISQLTLESFQPNEDATGLYSGPINYQTSLAMATADQVIQTGQPQGTLLVQGTFNGASSPGIQLDNRGTGWMGNGNLAIAQDGSINTSTGGGVTTFQVILKGPTGDSWLLVVSSSHVKLLDQISGIFALDVAPDGTITLGGVNALAGSNGPMMSQDNLGDLFLGKNAGFAVDTNGFPIARAPILLTTGFQATGRGGARFSNCVAGDTVAVWVPFPVQLENVPTSITLANITSVNANTIAADNLSVYGFRLNWKVTANGATEVLTGYTTVGN